MSTYETFVVIGMALWILVALALFISLLYGIALLRGARAPLGRVSDAVGDLKERLQPVLRNVERASEDAGYLASSLRSDADEVGRTLRQATDSTQRMVDLVEERVTEVAALLEVVQEEAEETFFSTASLLRGIRAGQKKSRARRLRRVLGGGG